MKDLLRYLAVAVVFPALRHLPLPAVRAVTAAAAPLQYAAYRSARRVIRRGLAADLGVAGLAAERLTLASFYHHLAGDFELPLYPVIDRRFVEHRIRFTGPGWDHLNANPGRGALLLTFHFGANQIIIPALPALGHPFTQVAVPPSYWDTLVGGGQAMQAANRRRTEHLEGTKATFIYVSEGTGAMRRAYRALTHGELVAIAGDGRFGGGRSYPFLGSTLDVALGGFKLAARCAVPLLPTIAVRTRGGFTVEIGAPVTVTDGTIEEAVAGCLAVLEGHVRRNPGQFGWMYHARAVGG